MSTIRRALLSVSDKRGIDTLAQALHRAGVEILSTGGTARLLAEAGVPVVEIGAYTGFPEMMDGRVKTLHPKVHGGILGRRGIDDETMAAHGIAPIDLVVVNLYPFQATVARDDCTLETAIEHIDIGGPTLIRAAAKNHAAVTVLVDPDDYPELITHLEAGQDIDAATRFRLAVKAFQHTAAYDAAIAQYLGGRLEGDSPFPPTYHPHWIKVQDLRYGENPHQQAAFYRDPDAPPATVASAEQLQGKALSFNNINDTDAALECVKQFGEPACVIVKHANPCGVAVAETPEAAYDKAYATDPTSAFGGIIALNRPLEGPLARTILERQFVEVIVAPEVDEDAQAVLATKPNVRVLACGPWHAAATPGLDLKRVAGGLLVQTRDDAQIAPEALRVVTRRAPDARELADLLFAWRVAKFVKSNAIVYAKDGQTVGIGAGQMSRVWSARIAAQKAEAEGLQVAGSVMASDAFFPFRDGIDAAAAAGVTAVIQPGGSMRDDEVIAAADEHGLAMVFTGIRHFRH